jgi:hypothetical protein
MTTAKSNLVEIIATYHPNIARLVRRLVPGEHWEQGEQVGAIALLAAHARYQTSSARGNFWPKAERHVERALQQWLDTGMQWRSPAGDLVSDAELKSRLAAFVATLPAKDQRLLLSTPRKRTAAYAELVKRAGAAVAG